ncbi:hypothetical protein Dsin_000610 [Dipteronia sinensis]|uniref:Uncharacterized protein n=1 Tax=Dipteronia sinensis TaxID=43782 RepID=A0AAE0EHY2_9ROSI|nr:hypothetical protein Dsin_000610 [Dipteronia sinensis]
MVLNLSHNRAWLDQYDNRSENDLAVPTASPMNIKREEKMLRGRGPASAGGVGGGDWFSSGSGGGNEQSPPVLATNYLSGDGFRLRQRNNFLKFSRSLEHNNFSDDHGGRFFSSEPPSSLRSIKTDLAISIAMDLSSR